MIDFDFFKRLFDSDNLAELTQTTEGLLWLKIKSISRGALLDEFYAHLNVPSVKGTARKFEHLYETLVGSPQEGHMQIDIFIRQKTALLSVERENSLVSELYRVQHFDWGGDYKNALDKYLVDTYVKEYPSYETINRMLETEIPRAVYGYVICSWYNHWSTILIENIFKKHPKVLSAVGNVKKVDFFIDNIPFDLKVTYLPTNFVEMCRKQEGLKSEFSHLKSTAKILKIAYGSDGRQKDVFAEIVARFKDSALPEAHMALKEITDFRKKLAKQCVENPRKLIQNLYEEQGEMRFDASNRLFLILIDTADFDASWKLKRNIDALTKTINAYVDAFDSRNIDKMAVSFSHKAKNGIFTAFSDALFVVK
jgi:hypothetical protein